MLYDMRSGTRSRRDAWVRSIADPIPVDIGVFSVTIEREAMIEGKGLLRSVLTVCPGRFAR